jgi:hypothetical protein
MRDKLGSNITMKRGKARVIDRTCDRSHPTPDRRLDDRENHILRLEKELFVAAGST